MTSPAAPSPTSSSPDADGHGGADKERNTQGTTAAGFPNPNGGGGGAEDGSRMMGKMTTTTTASGTKRGRGEDVGGHGMEEGNGGRGDFRRSPLLAVASGSADDATAAGSDSNRHGGFVSTIGGGGGRTGGGGGSLAALLSLTSPNALEGGRGIDGGGGGDENGGDMVGGAGGGGGTAMFAATIKRRRRGGDKTTSSSSHSTHNGGLGIESIEDLLRDRDADAEDARDDDEDNVAGGGGHPNGNDAEEQLDAIWKDVHSHHRNHRFGPGAAEGDEEDASATLLASPSTINTTNTFDTDNTHGSDGTDRHGTSPHTLLANLTSAALSKTESLLRTEMEALIASGVRAHHDRDAALRELELMKELAEGRGREVRRLQESERQSRETISNLLRNVESAKSDARLASRRIQAETRLRSENTTLRTERDAAYADAAESKRRAALAEEEARMARAQLGRCQRDKAQMERDSRAALSLARTLDGHTSTDSAYYKRQMAVLNEQVQKLHATVTEQNHTINELRRQRERSMSQNQLSQLRAGGGGGTGGGSKKSRHRK